MGEKENYIDNPYYELYLQDGIVFNIYKKGLKITLEIAKQMTIDKHKVSGGISRPVFVDARNLSSIEKDAREYLGADEGLTYVSGGAILINNSFQKLLAGAYHLINKPKVPSKVFTDERLALEWLKKFKHMN